MNHTLDKWTVKNHDEINKQYYKYLKKQQKINVPCPKKKRSFPYIEDV